MLYDMNRYTLSQLKNLVRCGIVHDITNTPEAKVLTLRKRCEKVGYSSGLYGINGGLIQDRETGDFYAVTARNANLFIIF